MHEIPQRLAALYAATIFDVEGPSPAVLKTTDVAGMHDPWLTSLNRSSATVVTGWNPFGVVFPQASNEASNARLCSSTTDLGLLAVPACGRDPLNTWAEESLCVFEASDALVIEWLLDLGQNAVLHLNLGEAPRLVWHPAYLGAFDSDAGTLSAADLLRRGWTEYSIQKLLGNADALATPDHVLNSRGKRTYSADRVAAGEGSADFLEVVDRQRRQLART